MTSVVEVVVDEAVDEEEDVEEVQIIQILNKITTTTIMNLPSSKIP